MSAVGSHFFKKFLFYGKKNVFFFMQLVSTIGILSRRQTPAGCLVLTANFFVFLRQTNFILIYMTRKNSIKRIDWLRKYTDWQNRQRFEIIFTVFTSALQSQPY